MLGPGGCSIAMTGSMKMSVERRRGCIAERWTLGMGVSLLYWPRFVVIGRGEQLCGADAVTYADEGTRHLRSEVVYHMEEISGVVGPRCWDFVSLM